MLHEMNLKQAIIHDVESLNNSSMLEQVFEFIQNLKRNDARHTQRIHNRDAVLALAGTLTNIDAAAMREAIKREFSTIEGEW